ncbi:MAG: hypothetical protein WD971_01140, partial [Pirellulales bacterium]
RQFLVDVSGRDGTAARAPFGLPSVPVLIRTLGLKNPFAETQWRLANVGVATGSVSGGSVSIGVSFGGGSGGSSPADGVIVVAVVGIPVDGLAVGPAGRRRLRGGRLTKESTDKQERLRGHGNIRVRGEGGKFGESERRIS